MDLKEQVRNVVNSLSPEEFLKLMTDLHFDYPLRTKQVTDQIVRGLKSVPSIKSEEFLKMVEERKAEYNQEIREKRERDRQRIQYMKSKTGRDPLDIFPKEIWKKILDDATPEDKRNFRQLHDFYRSLTEDNLVGDILLPLALTMLLKKTCEIEQGAGCQFLCIPVVPWSEFLPNLRLVSKSLRNAVDLWFEDNLLMCLRNNVKGQPSGMITMDLKGESDYEKFKEMKNDLDNEDESSLKLERFFTRALEFYLHEGEDEDNENDRPGINEEQMAEFHGNINIILDHIGHQIWYFSFNYYCPPKVESSTPSFAYRYSSLVEWLKRMPNLKWLKISIDRNEEEDELGPSWGLRNYFNLPEVKESSSLLHLERLDLELGKPIKYALPVFNKFLKTYPHVKLLNMYGIKSAVMNGIVLIDEPLRASFQLEALSCSEGSSAPPDPLRMLFGDSDDIQDKEEKEAKEKLINAFTGTGDARKELVFHMSWPLKRLVLEMDMHEQSVYCLLKSLENLPTLEDVSLDVKNATIRDDITYLNLPNLKSFQLEFDKLKIEWFEQEVNWAFFFSLQYLLQVKKLQTLVWKCDMAEDVWEKAKQDVVNMEKEIREGEILKFGDVMWDISLDRSNIWRVFPWLEKVKTGRVVTRGSEDGNHEVLKISYKKYRRSELKIDESDEEECDNDGIT